MTRAEIISLALEVGFNPMSSQEMDMFERFAALVAAAEREAVLQTIEALYDTQDPNPMYKEGYNHALDNIEQFIKGRANATLSEQGDKHET